MGSSEDVRVDFVDTGYGKSYVKILDVRRQGAVHHIKEYEVDTRLTLDSKKDYTTGDNSDIVATDTQKNTVYALAKEKGVSSAEQLGLDLCKHFLSKYSHVLRAVIHVEEAPWRRIESGGRKHAHAFISSPEATRFCDVDQRKHGSPIVTSGLKDMKVLKTTQSAFVNFHSDEYRLLPDMADRVFCTVVSARWTYANVLGLNFDAAWKTVQGAVLDVFAGPPDKGVFSPSVQQTVYDAIRAALARVPQISDMEMTLPNVHNYSYDFSKLPKLGVTHNDTVFVPFDKPSGIIYCKLRRQATSKL